MEQLNRRLLTPVVSCQLGSRVLCVAVRSCACAYACVFHGVWARTRLFVESVLIKCRPIRPSLLHAFEYMHLRHPTFYIYIYICVCVCVCVCVGVHLLHV